MTPSELSANRRESRTRRVLRDAGFTLALSGLAGIPLLYLTGGFELHVFGVEIRAHRPQRALWVSAAGAIVFVVFSGRPGAAWRNLLQSFESLYGAWDRAVVPWLPSPRTATIAIALGVFLLGAIFATKSAGGADAYGYVSQADLWLEGRLAIAQPFAGEVPWPRGRDTFMPLGYKATVRDDIPSIVPIYSPGLPLIFAVVKAIGGHDALFYVVPLLGSLLVLATYGIGCRLGSPGAGLIGAALVATSPAVLFMLMWPMTDVPVAAAWAAAFYLLTGPGARNAFAAGVVSGVAVMVRPNLVPLAAFAGCYYLPDLFRHESRGRAVRLAVLFTLGVLPGVIAVGAINNNLYGSPFLSGYGRLSDLFAWEHIRFNVRRYLIWLVQTHSPVAVAGLIALALPFAWLWPGVRERRRVVIAALFVFSTWAQYVVYVVFDEWWYLRFLLTAWPFMMVGAGVVAMGIWHPGGRLARTAVVAGVVLQLLFQTGVVVEMPAFDQWHGQWRMERRYITAAQTVQRLTPPNSVILSMQHSGTVRYYGSRMTLRYDHLDPRWLDRAVAWLDNRGAHPYLIVESWELSEVVRRFAGSDTVATLAGPPVAVYDEPGLLFLYDLRGPPATPAVIVTGIDDGLRAVPPEPAPTLVFHPETN
jgi:hypothetical protein